MEEIIYAFIIGGGATAVCAGAKLVADTYIEKYRSKSDSERNL